MTKSNECSYEIGGQTFFQRPLVLGQIEQLVPVLEALPIDGRKMGADDILRALGARAPLAFAVVLAPEGSSSPQSKDLEQIAEHFRWNLDMPMALEVIDDFLSCNRISWMCEQAGKIRERLTGAGGRVSEAS